MTLSDIFSKLTKNEPYNDLAVFEYSYDNYEEFPIVSRYKKVDDLKATLTDKGAFEILISLACFVLNCAIVHTSEKKIEKSNQKTLLGLSFDGFDDFEDNAFVVPKIFVFPGIEGARFLKKLINLATMEESDEMTLIRRSFRDAGVLSNFDFYESRFFDAACGEELVRIYAIPTSRRIFKQIRTPPFSS